jgi:hypothetical protein
VGSQLLRRISSRELCSQHIASRWNICSPVFEDAKPASLSRNAVSYSPMQLIHPAAHSMHFAPHVSLYRQSRTDPTPYRAKFYVSFCLMKKARRCDSCHTHVTPRTTSWMMVQRTTRAFVVSDWSRNSASRSCVDVSYIIHLTW